MRSSQDRIPTHRLGDVMALDIQGRVLRKPHFLTRREHEEAMTTAANAWGDLVVVEQKKVKAAEARAQVVIYPRILCRRRMHWLVKRIIKIK